MKLKLSNYNKPSNKTFKLIGDILIYAIPVYIPIIMSSPISETYKSWIIAIMTTISSTVKLISKFTTDNTGDTVPVNNI